MRSDGTEVAFAAYGETDATTLGSSSSDTRPIFVLCCGRTGSTLLRRILDGHPDVACPPETNLSAIFARLHEHLGSIDADADGFSTTGLDDLCRLIASRTVGEYARKHGARRWADKSLTSANDAELLHRLFPDAQFICLYRECRDTVASLLESSPFGFQRFGLEPYVAHNPHNLLQAAASLWFDVTSRIHTFSQAHPDSSRELRYEDLVTHPEETSRDLFAFLGLTWDSDLVSGERLFSHTALSGYGDHKIAFKTRIDATSIGRGLTLPMNHVAPVLVERVSELQQSLGYPTLDDVSKVIPRPLPHPHAALETALTDLLPVARVTVSRLDEPPGPPVRPRTEGQRYLDSVFAGVAQRLNGRDPEDTPSAIAVWVIENETPWIVDFGLAQVRRAPEPTDFSVLVDTRTLRDIIDGALNPAVAVSRGQMRVTLSKELQEAMPAKEAHRVTHAALRRLVSLLLPDTLPSSRSDPVGTTP